jgi:hypothetical protein
MRYALRIAGLAALMALGAVVNTSPVSAQEFGIRIGPDRPRVIERRIYREPRVIERRVVRPARVCRTEIRERVRPNGVVVRRPVQVCTTRGY